ncbi:MAG: adenylosuccinate lyase, partial [Firmicutes bacterium]|nr:adenylosuccinate lyase [Bacillota bacterium]
DAVLRLVKNVADGLVVNEKIVEKTLRDYLPFSATENILMEGVNRGGDRQKLHEVIRRASMNATAKMKAGEPWDLLEELSAEPSFGMTKAEMENLLDPKAFTGRSAHQVEAFVSKVMPRIADEDGTAINSQIEI